MADGYGGTQRSHPALSEGRARAQREEVGKAQRKPEPKKRLPRDKNRRRRGKDEERLRLRFNRGSLA